MTTQTQTPPEPPPDLDVIPEGGFSPKDAPVVQRLVAQHGPYTLTSPPAPLTAWETMKFSSVWERDDTYRRMGWAVYPEIDHTTLREKSQVPEFKAWMEAKTNAMWATSDQERLDLICTQCRNLWERTPEFRHELALRKAQRTRPAGELPVTQQAAMLAAKTKAQAEKRRAADRERYQRKKGES